MLLLNKQFKGKKTKNIGQGGNMSEPYQILIVSSEKSIFYLKDHIPETFANVEIVASFSEAKYLLKTKMFETIVIGKIVNFSPECLEKIDRFEFAFLTIPQITINHPSIFLDTSSRGLTHLSIMEIEDGIPISRFADILRKMRYYKG